MKLWTEQAASILAMLKLRKEFRVLVEDGAKTVDMLHIKSRRRWTFSRADFNRAKLALKGY